MHGEMKANELMIGDWVFDTEDECPVQVNIKDFRNGGNRILCSFEPIPLTAKILEKNGFIYNYLPFVLGWEQFGLTIRIGGNGFRIDCGINVSMIIDSVHELQHALRLCGIDKEIVI